MLHSTSCCQICRYTNDFEARNYLLPKLKINFTVLKCHLNIHLILYHIIKIYTLSKKTKKALRRTLLFSLSLILRLNRSICMSMGCSIQWTEIIDEKATLWGTCFCALPCNHLQNVYYSKAWRNMILSPSKKTRQNNHPFSLSRSFHIFLFYGIYTHPRAMIQ